MHGKFILSLSEARKATVTFLAANAGVASGRNTIIFLSAEGVHFSQQGYADDIQDDGFNPLKGLMTSFVESGGQLFVCSSCFKKRRLNETDLLPGAVLASGAELAKFTGAGDCSCPGQAEARLGGQNLKVHSWR